MKNKSNILMGIVILLLSILILFININIESNNNRIDKLEKVLFEIEKNGISLN